VIIVDSPSEPPFFVSLAGIEKPPKSYSYPEVQTPIFIERLKSEFPDAGDLGSRGNHHRSQVDEDVVESEDCDPQSCPQFAEFASHQRGDKAQY
jgi:hypothetical protein